MSSQRHAVSTGSQCSVWSIAISAKVNGVQQRQRQADVNACGQSDIVMTHPFDGPPGSKAQQSDSVLDVPFI